MTYISKVERISPRHNFTYDGATVNIFHANKGQGLPKHVHNYAHANMCHAGKCIVRVDDLEGGYKEYEVTKDTQPISLAPGEWHEIEALEDNTVFVNVFAAGKY